MSVQETNGYLDVENATLRSSKIEVTSNLAIGNTNPQHAFSVGSNLYVSGDSPDVLTVDGNVVCEGVKVGLIEIIPSYDLEAVANVGNSTSNTIQFTNTDTSLVTSGRMNIGGDIIPDTDGVYDIGSPDFKIREVFTSDNSLWIGDQTKIAFENGKMRFKRRKLDKVPKVVRELVIGNVADITDEAGVESAAVAYAQEQFPDDNITELADLKLQHWRDYTKSIDETKEISDIFVSNDEDYEAQSAADAFKEVGSNIFTTHGVTIGANTEPRAILDIIDTGAVIVPVGTTAERPPTAVNGMLRYNSETGYFEAYTVSGWGSIATPPSIASFTPTAVDTSTSSGTQITVTGSFFDQNSSIKLRGSDGTEYSTTGFSFTSTTSISATLPSLPIAKSPYTVVVTAGSGLSTESTDTLVSGNTPVWISPAEGATVSSSSTITLEATGDPGETITYSIVSGLPEGLSFDGNTISGTSTETPGSTSTITVQASDGDLYADRTFIIETPLYAFTSHTFTNAGATGRYGPTLTALTSAYTPTWTDDTNFLNVVTTGIQEWTVPATGTYQIQAAGAEGGSKNTTPGGIGAVITFNVNLNKSEIISIVVGQSGIDATASSSDGASGGGGSFIWYKSNLTLIGAAGGGGGIGGSTSTLNKDAFITDSIPDDGSNANPGGQNGTGGDRTGHPANWGGGGGGGWLTAGIGPPENPQTRDNKPSAGYHGYGGKSRTGGFVGGDTNSIGHVSQTRFGGFGGGGGGTAASGAGGGGGGYSGGYGGGTVNDSGQIPGSGGSSYSITSLISSSVSNLNHGFVEISKI
jgi:hypothetical protein